MLSIDERVRDDVRVQYRANTEAKPPHALIEMYKKCSSYICPKASE